MRAIAIFLFALLLPFTANATTCTPGYYLDDNGDCVKCKYPGNHYCPGDGTKVKCPDSLDDYNELANETYGESVILSINKPFVWGDVISSPKNCYMDIYIRTQSGKLLKECSYSSNNGYWCPWGDLWYTALHGYYLSKYSWTSSHDWYNGVRPCTNPHPTNSHYSGPGTPDSPDGTIVDANDCPWECDSGYGQHNNSCLPLCTAGFTKMHIGNDIVFNVYRDKITTPSINVMSTSGAVCHVPVASGRGRLNISDGTNIWHATN